MDRKAALLAGLEVQDWEMVDIDPKTCDPALWPEVVARIDMSVSPSRLSKVQGRECASPTQAEIERVVRESVEQAREEQAERDQTGAAYLAEYRREWATLTPSPCELYAYMDGEHWVRAGYHTPGRILVSEDGQEIRPPERSRYGCACAPDAAKVAIEAEYAPALAALEAAVLAHNAQVFARDLPAAIVAFEAARGANAAAELATREARAKADSAKRAARLESGYWELETGSYNNRRYSAPWCARVTFPSGAKPAYEFGDSTGKWGKDGLLRVECRPGDIVAWGQKDLRRPANSEHHVLIMQAEGRMVETDKTGAFRHWQQMHKPSVAQADDGTATA